MLDPRGWYEYCFQEGNSTSQAHRCCCSEVLSGLDLRVAVLSDRPLLSNRRGISMSIHHSAAAVVIVLAILVSSNAAAGLMTVGSSGVFSQNCPLFASGDT